MSEFPCEVEQKIKGKYEFILFFAKNLAEANANVKQILDAWEYDGYLWFCYPKGSSKKYKSDINRDKA